MYGVVRAEVGRVPVRLTIGSLQWTVVPPAADPPITLDASLTNLLDQFCYVLTVPFETCLPGDNR